MFVKNIKRSIISLLLTFAVILSCGCQNAEDIPQTLTSDGEVSSPTKENTDDIPQTLTSGSEASSLPEENTADNSNIVTTLAVTTERTTQSIPDEWIYIHDSWYVLTHFNKVMNADCSDGKISDIISALVHKNILFTLIELNHTFEADPDNPITYGEEEITLYPATSLFFPNVKSVYDLAYSIYDHSVEDIYIYDPSTVSFYLSGREEPILFFTEIDGQMYANPDCTVKKGGPESFVQTSYIEITDQSEDRCSFIWHYPDVEGLNEPDKYYTFFYEKEYTAVYSDGAWRLTEVIRR